MVKKKTLLFVSNSSIDNSFWWIFFSDSVVMNAMEQNHVISRNIIFECVCHGFEMDAIEPFDMCAELLVRFDSDDDLIVPLGKNIFEFIHGSDIVGLVNISHLLFFVKKAGVSAGVLRGHFKLVAWTRLWIHVFIIFIEYAGSYHQKFKNKRKSVKILRIQGK